MGPYIHQCLDTFMGILESQAEEHPEGFDVIPYVQ